MPIYNPELVGGSVSTHPILKSAPLLMIGGIATQLYETFKIIQGKGVVGYSQVLGVTVLRATGLCRSHVKQV